MSMNKPKLKEKKNETDIFTDNDLQTETYYAKGCVPADYSYLEIMKLSDREVPIAANFSESRKAPKKNSSGRYLTNIVWLSNNYLASLGSLVPFLETRIEEPQDIIWMDVSFNMITRIDQDLLQLTNLGILYLQCNCLDSWEEVARLKKLKRLKILALYGNPIETVPDYRLRVIALVPHLRRLDFSPVTENESDLAQTYTMKEKTIDRKESRRRKESLTERNISESYTTTQEDDNEDKLRKLEDKEQQLDDFLTFLVNNFLLGDKEKLKKRRKHPCEWHESEENSKRTFKKLQSMEKNYVFNYYDDL